MEELSFKSMGILEYPVKNRSGNYEKECRIRFAVNVQALISDPAEYRIAAAGTDIGKYIRDNMPRFMKQAFREAWSGALPMLSLGRPEPIQEPIGRILGAELGRFGLRFRSFTIVSVALNAEDEAALRAHEIPLSQADREEIRKHMLIDVSDRPQAEAPGGPAGPEPAPEPVKTWDCGVCGMKGLTSRFCPECGTPAPKKS